MKTKYQKTKPGYTFVELIIAMVILFLAVMVIGSIFPASFKSLLKSKQVTIATTLAQQKLEECLVNPKDYKTRVGGVVTNGVLTGNFSPDHPEYSYSITEKTVTNKLKELKVEVYKLVSGKQGIVDAAVAQLVQSNSLQRFYNLQKDGDYSSTTTSDWQPIPNMSKTINFPEDGICIVNGSYSGYSPSGPILVNLRILYDGTYRNLVFAHASGAGRDIALSVTDTIKVTKETPHTIALYYAGTAGYTFVMYHPHMSIQYIPNSLIDVNKCEFLYY